ncbi:hypothetical protein QQF64_009568 [Cirrhinus molitorella]|uniref:Uncharacterized protein n=1 Tax=Cirrhinus molitorella TaxID=172907 RepID=A0ABR3M3W5_9TELE
MTNTVARFEDILRTELMAMQNKLASHMSVVQLLCSKLDFVTGEMREQKKVVAGHNRRVAATGSGQNHDRCSNLHLVGLHEGSEKDDPMGYRRGSRVWQAKRLKELILQAARLHAPVKTSNGATVSFFADFSPVTTTRSAFAPIRKEMREAGILLYPATLNVILNQGDWMTGVAAHLVMIMALYERLGQRWRRVCSWAELGLSLFCSELRVTLETTGELMRNTGDHRRLWDRFLWAWLLFLDARFVDCVERKRRAVKSTPVVLEDPTPVVSGLVVAEDLTLVVSALVVLEDLTLVVSSPVVLEDLTQVVSALVVLEDPTLAVSTPVVLEDPTLVVSAPVVLENPTLVVYVPT